MKMQKKILLSFIAVVVFSFMMVPAKAFLNNLVYWSNGPCLVRNGASYVYGQADFEIDTNAPYFIWYMGDNIGFGWIERYHVHGNRLIFVSTFVPLPSDHPLYPENRPQPLIGRTIHVVAQLELNGIVTARGRGFYFRGQIFNIHPV